MVNCLDVHGFILSLPALWLMLQFDAVLELTAILKFSIKLLTTSNERPTQYEPLGRDRPGCQAPWTI